MREIAASGGPKTIARLAFLATSGFDVVSLRCCRVADWGRGARSHVAPHERTLKSLSQLAYTMPQSRADAKRQWFAVGRSSDRMIGQDVGRPVHWSVGRSVGRSDGRSADRSIARLVNCSSWRSVSRSVGIRWIGRSVARSAGLSVLGRLVGLSVDRSVARSVARSVGCLVSRSTS